MAEIFTQVFTLVLAADLVCMVIGYFAKLAIGILKSI